MGHYRDDDLNSETVFAELNLQPVHFALLSGNYIWD